ncbi:MULTISPECIES: hypothetical protein [Psychrobacter]|uniref:hypothetical protein n=1 Tax=Psychrobacter TaxID=497 RepID=UPI0012FE92D5|nr:MULTISPECIES: hypothetical protein [Psychrobacter]
MDNQEKLTTHSLESESMNRELITKCDEPFLKQVEQNLIDIVIFQQLRFRVRLFRGMFSPISKSSKFINKYWSSIRRTLLILCMIVTLLLLLCAIFFDPFNLVFLALFIIYSILTFGIWFLKMSPKNRNLQRLGNYIDRKSAEKSAKRILKVAAKILPFDAHYLFSDNLVTYSRLKDENTGIVFSKKLEKFAVVHSHATLLYKSSTTIFERTLIMHDGQQQIIDVLARLDIEFIIYTPEIYKDLLEELSDTIY